MNKKKQSNVELLRIVSMIMIIILHFLGHGKVLEEVKIGTGTYYFSWFLDGISYVSVNIYVLISGYFLCKSEFKIKKLINLFIEVLFYSTGIYILLISTNIIQFNIKECFKSFLPIINNQYWFVTRYIVMYICSPFINIFVNAMNKKQHITFIIVSTVLCCIIAIFYYAFTGLKGPVTGISSIWFMLLYITAAYIRNYYVPNKDKIKKYLIAFLMIIVLFPITKIACDFLSNTPIVNIIPLNKIKACSILFISNRSIVVYLASIMLFVAFLNIDIRKEKINKVILKVSSLTFAVYLIHDNNYIRGILWNIIKPYKYMYNWYFPLYLIISVIFIFTICIAIDYIRNLIFKRIFKGNIISSISNKLEIEYEKYITKYIGK